MNMQDWLEIKLQTTEQYDSDRLEEALFAAGALSVTLTSKADEAILIEPAPGELPLWEKGMIVTGLFAQGFAVAEALPVIKACLDTDNPPLIGLENLADRAWALEWTKYFHPIRFGEHLWICPSNKVVPADKITTDTQIITLDPGLAFGTGTHPTTAMVLQYIATHADNMMGKHIIDFGCGSGVLGIAALKMGAEHALMTDIDPQALVTTQANAEINQVREKISCYLPDKLPRQTTDFLIANILLEPLLSLKDTFIELCHDNSIIILTGLLNEQVEAIIAHYDGDFADFTITHQDDWAMVTAKRSNTKSSNIKN